MAKGSSRARPEISLKIWLSSFQHSSNSTTCLSQGSGDRTERGHGEKGCRRGRVADSLVKGIHPRSEKGHPCNLTHKETCTSSDRKSPEAFSPLGSSCLV